MPCAVPSRRVPAPDYPALLPDISIRDPLDGKGALRTLT